MGAVPHPGIDWIGDRGEHHVGGAAGPSLAQRQRVSRSEPDLFGGVGVAHQRHRLRVVAMGNRSGRTAPACGLGHATARRSVPPDGEPLTGAQGLAAPVH